jgi:hypothetical protein
VSRISVPVLVATVAVCVLTAVAGCGRSAGDSRAVAGGNPRPSGTPSARPTPSVRVEPPSLGPLPTPSLRSASPGFPEEAAVSCAGRPTAEQVITVLRRNTDVLPAGATVTVRVGPLCAGTWQFTEIEVPDREPLRVLTRGAPGSLTFVTAGTYVCTSMVRTTAPTGILAVAHCL